MRHTLTTILLGPLLLYQGRRVRKQVPLLPEPSGDRVGTTGTGPELKLLILGDSAAAGVGADTQQEALVGQIVERLTSRFTVNWRLHAVTGATTASTIERLRHLESTPYDVVVTSLGVNDVTAMVSKKNWLTQQRALRSKLKELFQPSLIVLSGFPPVHLFPALPQPLRWYLGRRSQELDSTLLSAIRSESRVIHLPIDFAHGTHLMASDGFHPGPPAYAIWGERVADVVFRNMTSGSTAALHVSDT